MVRTTLMATALLLAHSYTSVAGEIKPEMIVTFSKGTIVCVDRNDLLEITLDAIKGEETKAEGLMLENGGDCVMAPPTKRFKVLSAEYNLPGSDLGILEILGEHTIRANGAWAYSAGAVEVK